MRNVRETRDFQKKKSEKYKLLQNVLWFIWTNFQSNKCEWHLSSKHICRPHLTFKNCLHNTMDLMIILVAINLCKFSQNDEIKIRVECSMYDYKFQCFYGLIFKRWFPQAFTIWELLASWHENWNITIHFFDQFINLIYPFLAFRSTEIGAQSNVHSSCKWTYWHSCTATCSKKII